MYDIKPIYKPVYRELGKALHEKLSRSLFAYRPNLSLWVNEIWDDGDIFNWFEMFQQEYKNDGDNKAV